MGKLPQKVAQRFVFAMIPPDVLAVAKKVSAQLTAKGVKHAIAGGMAVSFYGFVRMTQDVDVLLSSGDRAVVDEFGDSTALSGYLKGLSVIVDGVEVDFLFAAKAVKVGDITSVVRFADLPVVKVEPLIVMKLGAGRTKDTADIVELVKAGNVPVDVVKKRLRGDMAEDFTSIVAIAEAEKAGRTKTARALHLAMQGRRSGV